MEIIFNILKLIIESSLRNFKNSLPLTISLV